MSNFLIISVENDKGTTVVGRIPLTDDLAEFGFGDDLSAATRLGENLAKWEKSPRLDSVPALMPFTALLVTLETDPLDFVPRSITAAVTFQEDGKFVVRDAVIDGLRAVVGEYAKGKQ